MKFIKLDGKIINLDNVTCILEGSRKILKYGNDFNQFTVYFSEDDHLDFDLTDEQKLKFLQQLGVE